MFQQGTSEATCKAKQQLFASPLALLPDSTIPPFVA